MFVTKRRYFDFVTLFCLYQVCLKCRKLIYELKPFLQMKLPPQSRRKGHAALTSCYIGLQKTKKVTFFYQLAPVRTRRKRVPFFYQFCCHSKRLARFHATMFHNIQQFHSGGSNTNSFRLLATLFKTKNSIDMRICAVNSIN